MLKHPRFKPHLQVEVRNGEGVFLLSESQQTVLQGRLYEAIVPLLDGRAVEDVCRQLGDQVQPSHVFYTLNKLEKQGVLCETEHAGEQTAIWTLQGIDPQVSARRLASTTVSVTSFGIDTTPFEELLAALHVRLADEGDLQVVVTDHYLRPELSACNRDALRTGRPWLLVKPLGGMIWFGPLFRPGSSACWECLAERIRANFPVLGYLHSASPDQPLSISDRAQSPATIAVGWGMAAHSLATFLATDSGDRGPGDHGPGACCWPLEGRIHTLNVLNWQSESHLLVKQPACPACGSPNGSQAALAPSSLTLQSCKKTYTDDGGHRARSPEETLNKYSYHVSSICGAVSRLEKCVPADDGVMHVYVSGNNAARGPQSLMGLRTDLRHSSAGKGISEVQAKASALCEGLERFSGIFRGDEPRRAASYSQLGEEAVHPNQCMLFSQRQYQERAQRNADCSIFNYIPLPLDPERILDWSPLWSLTQERPRYLPTAFCYYKYPSTLDTDFCVSCSNGNAAGNSLEEAIFQGFLELAERDSVSLWWYNRLRMPGVDLDRVGEPYLDRLRDYLASQHRELWVLDLTSDLRIPAVVAVSRRTDGPSEQIMFGFGAHLEPRIAILRAVTELNQMLVPLLQYPEEHLPGFLSDPDTLRWLKQATIAEQSFVVPEGPLSDIASYERQWADDLREDVLSCQSKVESLGLEMLVLNQTRAEIGMPVVKVVVPGLRHFWSRYAPGRLYDVPVSLGRLSTPLTEEQLNPIPLFL